MAIVVVDSAGHAVAAERMDGAPFVALALAEEKAWTAAAFGAPTTDWGRIRDPESATGASPVSALGGGISVLAGGVPLNADGRCIGAVGVSGGTDVEDHNCALHAAEPNETR